MLVGDPLDPGDPCRRADLAASIWKRCSATSSKGRAEGARVLTGGDRVEIGNLAKGAFVAPTVFDGCRDDMAIVREEIFGPVMTVLAFDDEDEVIAPRQRHRVRPRGRRLHAGPPRGAPGHRSAGGRHLLDQPVQRHADRAALRRRQAVRARPRELARRGRALHPAQERLCRARRHRGAVLIGRILIL